MKTLLALPFALALTVVGGCASMHGSSYASVPQTVRVHSVERASAGPVAPWTSQDRASIDEQAQFVAEMERRMDRATDRAHARFERGELPRDAIGQLARERSYVDGLLARYSADGKLTRNERIHIETSVDQFREAASRTGYRTRAIGGGPGALH